MGAARVALNPAEEKRELGLLAASFLPQWKGVVSLLAPLSHTPMPGMCPLLSMSHSALLVQSVPTPSL